MRLFSQTSCLLYYNCVSIQDISTGHVWGKCNSLFFVIHNWYTKCFLEKFGSFFLPLLTFPCGWRNIYKKFPNEAICWHLCAENPLFTHNIQPAAWLINLCLINWSWINERITFVCLAVKTQWVMNWKYSFQLNSYCFTFWDTMCTGFVF